MHCVWPRCLVSQTYNPGLWSQAPGGGETSRRKHFGCLRVSERSGERAMVGGRWEGQENARTCESLAGMTIMGFCSLNAATLSTACLTDPTPKNFSHQLSFPLPNFISSSASLTTPSTISVNSLSPSDHSSPSLYKPPIKPFFLNGVSEITSGIFADGFSSGYSNSDQ